MGREGAEKRNEGMESGEEKKGKEGKEKKNGREENDSMT